MSPSQSSSAEREGLREIYCVLSHFVETVISIQVPGKIHLVLEYCRGGDLSFYIQQRHGRIPEAVAKHFLQQLGTFNTPPPFLSSSSLGFGMCGGIFLQLP